MEKKWFEKDFDNRIKLLLFLEKYNIGPGEWQVVRVSSDKTSSIGIAYYAAWEYRD